MMIREERLVLITYFLGVQRGMISAPETWIKINMLLSQLPLMKDIVGGEILEEEIKYVCELLSRIGVFSTPTGVSKGTW